MGQLSKIKKVTAMCRLTEDTAIAALSHTVTLYQAFTEKAGQLYRHIGVYRNLEKT